MSGASPYFKNRLPLLSTRVNVLVFDTLYVNGYGLVQLFRQTRNSGEHEITEIGFVFSRKPLGHNFNS